MRSGVEKEGAPETVAERVADVERFLRKGMFLRSRDSFCGAEEGSD